MMLQERPGSAVAVIPLGLTIFGREFLWDDCSSVPAKEEVG